MNQEIKGERNRLVYQLKALEAKLQAAEKVIEASKTYVKGLEDCANPYEEQRSFLAEDQGYYLQALAEYEGENK